MNCKNYQYSFIWLTYITMSWNWYTSECPVCENDMDVYEDTKPFPTANCWCPHCWFVSYNTIDRMTLEEINDTRKFDELELMTQEEYNKYNNNEHFIWLTI